MPQRSCDLTHHAARLGSCPRRITRRHPGRGIGGIGGRNEGGEGRWTILVREVDEATQVGAVESAVLGGEILHNVGVSIRSNQEAHLILGDASELAQHPFDGDGSTGGGRRV
jgi:hypothetical protein